MTANCFIRQTKADFLKEQARAEERKCLTPLIQMANFFSEGGGNENKSRNKQEGVKGEMMAENVRWEVVMYIITFQDRNCIQTDL